MQGEEGVAIFWDYENCPVPSNASGYSIVDNIRSLIRSYGSVKSFKAYLEISEQVTVQKSLSLRSELQSSGVSLVDCPHNGRKDVADKMIIVDMLAHAIDNPAPSTVVLITGDRDFAYAISILRLRRYHVILVALPNAHASLTAQASVCLDWNNYILDQTQTPGTGPNHARSSSLRERSRDPVTLSSPHSPRGQNARGTDDLDRKDRIDVTPSIRFAMQNRLDSQLSSENSLGYPALGRNGQNTSASGDTDCSGIRNAASPAALSRTLPSVLPKPADLPPHLSTSPSLSINPPSAPSSVKPYPTPSTTAISTPTENARGIDDLDRKYRFDVTQAIRSATQNRVDSQLSSDNLIGSPGLGQHDHGQNSSILHDLEDLGVRNGWRIVPPHTSPSAAPSSIRPSPSYITPNQNIGPSSTVKDPDNTSITAIPATSRVIKDHYLQRLNGSPKHDPPPSACKDEDLIVQPSPNKYIPDNSFLVRPASAPSSFPSSTPSTTAVTSTPTPIASTSFVSSPQPSVAPSCTPSMVFQGTSALPSLTPFTTVVSSPTLTASTTIASYPPSSVAPLTTPLSTVVRGTSSSPSSASLKAVVSTPTTALTNLSSPPQPPAAPSGSSPSTVFKGASGTSVHPALVTQVQAAIVVPENFKILVECLQTLRSKGTIRPLRSIVATQISKNHKTYKKAGVEKFGQYVALAEKLGMVELGGREGADWISLKPNWHNAAAS